MAMRHLLFTFWNIPRSYNEMSSYLMLFKIIYYIPWVNVCTLFIETKQANRKRWIGKACFKVPNSLCRRPLILKENTKIYVTSNRFRKYWKTCCNKRKHRLDLEKCSLHQAYQSNSFFKLLVLIKTDKNRNMKNL